MSFICIVQTRQDHLELRMALLEAEQRNQALLRAAQRAGPQTSLQYSLSYIRIELSHNQKVMTIISYK